MNEGEKVKVGQGLLFSFESLALQGGDAVILKQAL